MLELHQVAFDHDVFGLEQRDQLARTSAPLAALDAMTHPHRLGRGGCLDCDGTTVARACHERRHAWSVRVFDDSRMVLWIRPAIKDCRWHIICLAAGHARIRVTLGGDKGDIFPRHDETSGDHSHPFFSVFQILAPISNIWRQKFEYTAALAPKRKTKLFDPRNKWIFVPPPALYEKNSQLVTHLEGTGLHYMEKGVPKKNEGPSGGKNCPQIET